MIKENSPHKKKQQQQLWCIGCRLHKFWFQIFLYYYASSFHSSHIYLYCCASLSCFVAPTHTYTDIRFIIKWKGRGGVDYYTHTHTGVYEREYNFYQYEIMPSYSLLYTSFSHKKKEQRRPVIVPIQHRVGKRRRTTRQLRGNKNATTTACLWLFYSSFYVTPTSTKTRDSSSSEKGGRRVDCMSHINMKYINILLYSNIKYICIVLLSSSS